MIEKITGDAVPLSQWEKLTPEQRVGKFSVGVLYQNTEKPEYCEAYRNLQERAMNKVREAARKVAEQEALKARDEILGATSGEN